MNPNKEATDKWIDFENPQTGNKVGRITEINGKKIYVSDREKTHYFGKYHGFGVSEIVLTELKQKRIEDIWLFYKPTGELFQSKLKQFEDSEEYENIENDLQKVLALKHFKKPTSNKLYEDMLKLMKEYLYVKEEEYHIFVLWILHTYMVEDFGVTPYIRLNGNPSSGKSTIMRFCRNLVGNGISGSFSVATIYRILKSNMPSLFFNEFEEVKEKRDLLDVLNNGYENGQTISKMDNINDSVITFSPFCPKMFGTVCFESIGTLDSRSIIIRTESSPRKLKNLVSVDKKRDEEFFKLKERIKNIINLHRKGVLKTFDTLDLNFMNRDRQIILPLAAIEEYFGFPKIIENYYSKLLWKSGHRKLENDYAFFIMKTLFNKGKMLLKELTKIFNRNFGIQKNEHYIGSILRNKGFEDYITRHGKGTIVEIPTKMLSEFFEAQNINIDWLKEEETSEVSEQSEPKEESVEQVNQSKTVEEAFNELGTLI
jgi:hypothetical protein